MSSNLPIGAEYDSRAPWLDGDGKTCPVCGAEMHGVSYKHTTYYDCPDCGYTEDDEPEYERD